MSIFDHIAQRQRIGPGLVKAGKHLLFTADHPQVKTVLAYVRHHWHLPSDTPESILALAALEVFQHPTHPAHWVFWCNERKTETAKLVERHANARIPTVYHIMPWSTDERLFMLNLYHGGAWHNLIKDEPWYPKFFHKETIQQKGGPNLRKRKAVAAVDEGLEDDEDLDEEVVPVPKRTRSRQNAGENDAETTVVKRTSGRTVHKTAKVAAAQRTARVPSPVPSVASSSSMSSLEPTPEATRGIRSTSRLSSETLVDEHSNEALRKEKDEETGGGRRKRRRIE
ncbi:hypothetical protein D9758_001964 [Tetrapyrgos nigripes]|uniref:Uncharacterized protein n=1 Tax=Tetrapyrgos nigripes TaxID=182062 RepID=A0A8H5GTE5_9AGAR|nr:hypothetical protein D9758_001964 [Tetrapyrgos nigripes]